MTRPGSLRFIVLLLAALGLSAGPSSAQGDLEAERRSLRASGPFYVTATIEGPRQLATAGPVASGAVIGLITNRLREADLPVTAPPTRRAESELPFLHIHLNMIQADLGLVPFAAGLGFHQNVQLVRDQFEMTAVTWSEEVVGLISADNLPSIVEAINDLVSHFIEDYSRANR